MVIGHIDEKGVVFLAPWERMCIHRHYLMVRRWCGLKNHTQEIVNGGDGVDVGSAMPIPLKRNSSSRKE